MKNTLLTLVSIPLLFLSSCSIGQEGTTKTNLPAVAFAEKIQKAIDLSMQKYCGVSAMLSKTAEIKAVLHLI